MSLNSVAEVHPMLTGTHQLSMYIVLQRPATDPGLTDYEHRTITEMVASGEPDLFDSNGPLPAGSTSAQIVQICHCGDAVTRRPDV